MVKKINLTFVYKNEMQNISIRKIEMISITKTSFHFYYKTNWKTKFKKKRNQHNQK